MSLSLLDQVKRLWIPSRLLGRMAIAMVLILVAACDGSTAPSTSVTPTTPTRPGPVTTTPAGPVVVSPEFVQGVIPGAEVRLLVSQTSESAGTATVKASAPGATVTVQPSEISGEEVSEVTVVSDPSTSETELTISLEVVIGDTTHTATRTTTVHPWDDDRAEQAAEILALFTPWLAENRAELGVTPATEFDGTYLAPELLVVSHYGFFNDQWEIGVSWHVMIPPDDFAEIYLRSRSELRPSVAFRIESWQTALDTDDFEVVEVEPPFEVVR